MCVWGGGGGGVDVVYDLICQLMNLSYITNSTNL